MFIGRLDEKDKKEAIESLVADCLEFKSLTYSDTYFDELLFEDGRSIFVSTAYIELTVDGKPYFLCAVGCQALLIPRFISKEFKYKIYNKSHYVDLVKQGVHDITLPNGRLLLPALISKSTLSPDLEVREVKLSEFKKNSVLISEAVKQLSAYILENHCLEDFYMTASDKLFKDYQKHTFKDLSVFINSKAFKFILGHLEDFEIIEFKRDLEIYKAGRTLTVPQTRYAFKYID